MWRLKYLIYGMIPWAIIGVIGFLAAPKMIEAVEDSIADSARDAVAEVYEDEIPSTVEAGQIVITEDQLHRALLDADEREDNFNASGYAIQIEDGKVMIINDDRDISDDDFVIASAVPVVEDGEIKLTERGGAVRLFKFARDAIAEEIEEQTAQIFEASGVRPVSLTAENGRLTIVTESIGGATAATPVATRPASTLPTVEPTSSSGLSNPFNRTPTATP